MNTVITVLPIFDPWSLPKDILKAIFTKSNLSVHCSEHFILDKAFIFTPQKSHFCSYLVHLCPFFDRGETRHLFVKLLSSQFHSRSLAVIDRFDFCQFSADKNAGDDK